MDGSFGVDGMAKNDDKVMSVRCPVGGSSLDLGTDEAGSALGFGKDKDVTDVVEQLDSQINYKVEALDQQMKEQRSSTVF